MFNLTTPGNAFVCVVMMLGRGRKTQTKGGGRSEAGGLCASYDVR